MKKSCYQWFCLYLMSKKVGVVANNKQTILKQLIAADAVACNGFHIVCFSEQRKASKM
jgi:hypothetical protein